MSQCPTDADLMVSSNTPQGGGGPGDVLRNRTPNYEEIAHARDTITRRAKNKTEAVQAVIDAMGKDSPSTDASTVRDKAMQRGLSTRLVTWVEQAAEGLKEQYERNQEAIDLAAGLTSSGKSTWLNITNWMTRKFSNARSDLDKYFLLHHVQTDRSTQAQDLLQSAHMVKAGIAGFRQQFDPLVHEAVDMARPIAKRLGLESPIEAATIMGDWTNLRGVPERNAWYLKKWQEQINREMAKPAEKRNMQMVLDNQDKIHLLASNLDNEAPGAEVISCGWTNGEARVLQKQIEALGITEAELTRFADKLVEINRKVFESTLKNGLVHPEQVMAFPDWQNFTPFYSHYDNVKGVANDISPYNPGSYHEVKGTTAENRPDSAFFTTLSYIRKAATAAGSKDFATKLAMVGMTDKANNIDSGIRVVSRKKINKLANSNDPRMRHWAENFMEHGGYFVDLPTAQKDGSVKLEKKLVYFDPKWEDKENGLNGAMLNDALVAEPKLGNGLNTAAMLTSWYGQSFTRMQPTFSVINAGRDTVERSFHLAATETFDANGNEVRGIDLLGSYWTGTAKTAKWWLDGTLGNLEAGSKPKQYIDEYISSGLRQQYTPGIDAKAKTFSEIMEQSAERRNAGGIRNALRNDKRFAPLNKIFQSLGENGRMALDKLDNWNDYFNNLASFNHFVTLREAGVPRQRAAAVVMDSMNLSDTGTATPILRVLYPFVKPTFKSAAAMARSLGFSYDPRGVLRAGKNGWMYMAGATAALAMLKPLIAGAMGDDPETGFSRLDSMSMNDLQRFIPIPLDNGAFVKLPIGFGPSQIVATMVYGTDRVNRGLMTPTDFAAELLFCIVKNAMPGNWPEFNASDKPLQYITQMFSPSVLSPITEIASNTTRFGRTLTNATSDGTKALANQGRASTAMGFHQVAKWIHDTLGIDLAPEQVKALHDGYLVGPAKILDTAFGDAFSLRKGSAEESMYEGMNPYVKALGGTQWFGATRNVGRSMFYTALNKYQRRIRDANIAMTSKSYGSDAAKKEAYQREQLTKSGKFTPEEIDDILLLMSVSGRIRSMNSKLSDNTRQTWLNADSSTELRKAFEELAQSEGAIYNDTVKQLNYYKGKS